jgi:hypothetical protein
LSIYNESGAFNAAVDDTTGVGRYSASGALRIQLVSGSSYVGLYAADGAMNVVIDPTGRGLYHPSGAIRGVSADASSRGLYAPNGAYYFAGLTEAFSPLNLFSAGEQGVWYDPSDFSTMFQDSAGTTPVTAVEQPVGRILDKSGRGNHASQATSASRPVLSARVNQLLATATLSTQNVTTLAATYTLAFSGAGTVTASGTNIGVYSAGSNSLVCTAGTLTLTVAGSVTFADLRVTNDGVGLPAYQAVVTSTNYDTTGFPYYLRFDATDDSLATASVDFSATDKMSVFSGVRKFSDASQGFVAELSVNTDLNNGAFNIAAPGTNNNRTYRFRSKGTVQSSAVTNADYVSPITNVITSLGDISGDTAKIRVNGAQVVQSLSDQGTGNYGNYPLYIGSRAGTGTRLNGRIYSLIVRGAASTATEISNTETWVNGKTMAY